ncbi:MAG: mechanosensitive ion channel family protein, partial [Hungatella sp.]
ATTDYWTAKWELTESIKLTFDQEGIEIPYAQLDVHMHSES